MSICIIDRGREMFGVGLDYIVIITGLEEDWKRNKVIGQHLVGS